MTEDSEHPPTSPDTGQRLIALDKPDEVEAWCKSLGCTEVELRRAVLAIGPDVDRVRDFLATHQ